MKPLKKLLILDNKKCHFNYFIENRIEVGIELIGPEVKSIRCKDVGFNDCYVDIEDNECYLIGFYIGKYKNTHNDIPDTLRKRKLLLSKKEILKLRQLKDKKGITLIPLDIYFKGSWVKMNIGVCKGKKLFDKRQDLKKKAIEKDLRNN